MRRRGLASILPAAASEAIAKTCGLSPFQMVAINTGFESSVAAVVFRESLERFNAVNSKSFPIVNRSGIGVDLTKITKESFFKLIANSDRTAGFGEKEWDVLKSRLDRYQANFKHQFAALVLRNGLFSAAAFGARPMAQAFVNDRGEDLQKMTGLGRNGVENLATLSIRAALACATTPFDRVFTWLSSGTLSAPEVKKKILGEISLGDFGKSFKGAAARTTLCIMAASSLSEGILVGGMMQKWAEEKDFQYFSKLLLGSDKKAETEDVTPIAKSVDWKKIDKAIKDGGMNVGSVSANDVATSCARAQSSCAEIASEMAGSLKKEAEPKPSAQAAQANPISSQEKTAAAR